MELDGQPVSLKILRDVWASTHFTSGGAAALKQTRLTSGHFDKNEMTRMNVRLAVQVLSNTMINLATVVLPRVNPDAFRRLSVLYGPTLQLAAHVNHLVDVMNTRVTVEKLNIDLVNDPEHRHVRELLHVSAFVQRWRQQAMRDASTRVARPIRWLAKEAGEDAIVVGLGVAALARLHAMADFPLCLRRLDQDCAENHFANVRHKAGSSSATTDTCKLAGQEANVSRFAKSGKSNTAGAEPDPVATDMLFDQRDYVPSASDKARESLHVFY